MSASTSAASSQFKDSRVVFQTSDAGVGGGSILKLTRFAVVFENCNPSLVLRLSEALGGFKIIVAGREIYTGKGTVKNVLGTGASAVSCEVTLDEHCWRDVSLAAANGHFAQQLGDEFKAFVTEWEKQAKIRPEFKLVIADMQTYLASLHLWLNQVEAGFAGNAPADLLRLEKRVITEIAPSVVRTIDAFIESFEALAVKLEGDEALHHQAYLRRQLHPLLLCSPFAQRTYLKPLGHAGDFQMVDMMLRQPFEGSSLFAKMINVWLLGQLPAEAHRNRIIYLTRKLVAEGARLDFDQKKMRVFNIGCGPAEEVRRFIECEHISDIAALTLLDFDKQTFLQLEPLLEHLVRKHKRATKVRIICKPIQHLLVDSARSRAIVSDEQFDFIYCAGLFDYLSQETCRYLMNLFYDLLAPGGLLLATNVSDAMNDSRPFRYSMEYLLDWHLIYRNCKEMQDIAPVKAPADAVKIITEETGVNIFIEVRKPEHD